MKTVKPSLQNIFRISIRTAIVLTGISVTSVQAQADYRNIAFHPVPLSTSALNTHGQAENTFALSPGTAVTPDRNVGLSLQESIARYRTHIESLEAAYGPFSDAVAEQSLALGNLLIEAGDYPGSTDAFQRSLHIMRVNKGLYSAEQEEVMRKLINNQLSLRNTEEANELHQAMLHLQRHLYEKGSDEYISALLEWADWNVDLLLFEDGAPFLLNASQGASVNQNLVEAQERYIEVIELIRDSGTNSSHSKASIIHAEKKLAAINYIANSKTQFVRAGSPSIADTSNPFTPGNTRENRAEMAYFFNGSSALKRAIAYSLEDPQPDYLSIAEQMMVLGDWYLLFDRRAAALTIYENAFEVLDAVQASEDDITRIMTPGMPVSTPDANSSGSLASTNDYHGYIDVEFKVSKFGIATRPEVIGTSGEDESPVTKALIRKIRNERFRPAFIDGTVSSNENVKLRYFYSYN